MRSIPRKGKIHRQRGSELLELALALPFLLFLATGMMDFAGAWQTRQVLSNAAREGARLGSSQPMLDLNTLNPPTVQQICQDVANYLAQEGMSTTFMNGTSSNPSAGCATPTAIPDSTSILPDPVPLGWTYYSSGTYGLKIERTILISSTSDDASSGVSSTRVTLDYPFYWPFEFGRIFTLMGGGASGYSDHISIVVNSTMANTP
jgi:Flp pilus assembly protein TadG